MRIILKVILFPVTLLLTILVAACRLLCQFSNIVFSILAMLVFLIALGTMVFLHDPSEGIRILGLALLISPFGLPLVATFLVEVIGGFNDLLKEI